MPVLSIIACGMLEDELAYVLSQDRDLQQLILVENRECQSLLRKLKAGTCLPRTAPLDRVPMLLNNGHGTELRKALNPLHQLHFFKKLHDKMKIKGARQVTAVVNVLRLGLHVDLELLKSEVYENIRKMAPFSDGILLFYGTCGNALGKLEEDFAGFGCPLYFLKDKSGETVEDCISLALGGNEAYAEAMLACRGVGTIYLTPLWALNWKKMEEEAGGSPDLNKRYLQNSHYGWTAKINTGLPCGPDFHKNVRDFARSFGMEILEREGSPEVAKRSYEYARKAVIEKAVSQILPQNP
ncbi:MAG: DUF1638 domain-containing protein [Methanosarcinaceae archaeon]|nr:DUF1638 domain-containing protein [Methanosarcinaceae archaeon]